MRKASSLKTPWNDGGLSRRSLARLAPHEPLDATGFSRVVLPPTAAQGAGKMAPRGAKRARKVQLVGIASEQTKYALPVRTVPDFPDVHPLDRPNKSKKRRTPAQSSLAAKEPSQPS